VIKQLLVRDFKMYT